MEWDKQADGEDMYDFPCSLTFLRYGAAIGQCPEYPWLQENRPPQLNIRLQIKDKQAERPYPTREG